MTKQKTSIVIEEELWLKLKLFCVKSKIDISDYLEKIIDRSLKDNKSNEQLLKEILGVRSK